MDSKKSGLGARLVNALKRREEEASLAKERTTGDAPSDVRPLNPTAEATSSSSPKKSVEEIAEWLARGIASTTNVSAEELNFDEPFQRMGIDSLQAVTLISELNEWLGREVPPTVMFDYPNITLLSRYLADGRLGMVSAVAESRVEIRGSEREYRNEPIAVVGLGCRFPKADGARAYWELLKKGEDAIVEVPSNRWNIADYYSPTPDSPGKMITRFGGFLNRVDTFDNELFGISSREALRMDPQQRLLLEVTWEALESAGYAPLKLAGSQTGVFIGISINDYSRLQMQSASEIDLYDSLGNAHSIAANRISYFFNLKGPSWSVDTACSSSLVSVHQACRSLRLKETDMALAGGVNLILSPELSVAFSAARMLAPDGRCKTFSDKADGYVRGEGAGMVVLKRLSDALRDGDPILALIRGTAVNQDGRSNGITAPNGPSQEAVIKEALLDADCEADDLDYIEAHGTGTSLGDLVEYQSLSHIIGPRSGLANCRVGSVKTNIGHTEAAAGVAGLIKVILSLKNEWLPQHLHFTRLGPELAKIPAAIEIPKEGTAWRRGARKRMAGVSSFGFGGTNAHIVLEEAPEEFTPAESASGDAEPARHLFTLSAARPETLEVLATDAIRFLESTPEPLTRVCHQAYSRRSPLGERLAVHGKDRAELVRNLAAFLAGENRIGWTAGRVSKRRKKIAFLFTGQGAQSPRMGKALYDRLPVYRTAFDDAAERFNPFFTQDLSRVIFESDEECKRLLYQTDYGQASLFVLEYALATTLRAWGIKPDFVFGHSLGELSAACFAGALSLADAVRLVAARGKLMQSTATDGRMAIVHASAEALLPRLAAHEGRLEIAALNGPEMTVVSGHDDALTAFEAGLDREGVRHDRLKVDRAFHSPLMEPILDTFEGVAAELSLGKPAIPLVSSLEGKWLEQSYSAGYWRKHLRQPTRFTEAMAALREKGCEIFLEIGPHPTLLNMARAFVTDESCAWIATLNRKADDFDSLYQALAELHRRGFVLDIDQLEPAPKAKVIPLPLTPFSRTSFWPKKSAVAPEVPMPSQAAHASQPNRTDDILIALRNLVAGLLETEPERFDVDAPLVDLGADSLVLLNALETIKDRYGVAVPISQVFKDLSTVRAIAEFVAARAKPVVEAPVVTPPPAAIATPSLLPAAPPTIVSGDVHALVQQQLQLMALQLEVLKGASGTLPQTAATKPPVEAGKEPGTGVLSNWRSSVDRTVTPEADQRKKVFLETFIRAFTARTQKSKAAAQKYRFVLADNRTSAGFRPNTKEMIYPIVCDRAAGSQVWDIDGNNYVDFSMGFGVNLFGHSPELIQKRLEEQLAKGMALGPQSELAGQVAELVCELTGHARVAFCNSGTEAIMTALRLARAATKRDKIVIFEGAYHGHFDGVLCRSQADGRTIPVAPGVTKGLAQDVVVLPYGTEASVQYIREHAAELAAVLVESVQSRRPDLQPKAFLGELREITKASGTAFIFDEVITGFRIAPGGAQEHFGIKGDLAAYGKVLGGGLAIGAVAGSARFLDAIDGGFWQFGDDSYPKGEMTFFAGTFSKHPLAMAAAHASLLTLKQNGKKILGDLNARTAALAERLNGLFAELGLGIEVIHFGSLFRFKAAANLDLFFAGLNHRGIYVWEGRNLFLSTAHTDEDLDRLVKAVDETARELISAGFLTSRQTPAGGSEPGTESYPLTPSQVRFQRLSSSSPSGDQACHICVAVELKGRLDAKRLRTAFEKALGRHLGLTSRFDLKRGQQTLERKAKLHCHFTDLSSLPDQDAQLAQWMGGNAATRFDLSRPPALRLHVLRLAPERHLISLVVHHLVADGWSVAVLIKEAGEIYTRLGRGESVDLPHVSGFRDFADGFRAWLRSPEAETSKRFWLQRFPDVSPRLLWPGKGANDASDYSGERQSVELEGPVFEKIKAWSKSRKASPLVTLLGVFQVTLHRRTGATDLTIGVPTAGRNLPYSDSIVGNCVNLVPVRAKLENGVEVAAHVDTVRELMVGAYAHMDYPYVELEQEIGKPLFNVTFNKEPLSEMPRFDGLTGKLVAYPVVASEFDLTLNVTELPSGLHIEADYRQAALSTGEARALLDEYVQTLRTLV